MSSRLNQDNKRLVWEFWEKLEAAAEEETTAFCATHMVEDMPWHGPDPIDDLRGSQAFAQEFWLPFIQAFSRPHRESFMFFGGRSNGTESGQGDGRMWVCGTGFFTGVFAHDWLGIPASGKETRLRWGEFCRVENDKIAETYFLVDLIDLLRQAGHDVLPADRGAIGIWPPPRDDDAILLAAQDDGESRATLELIRRFIFESLNVYDQENLESMGVAAYFHPQVRWYGPGGIGACNGLNEFEHLHQQHWLHAFPDRTVQDLDCLFAEGDYSGASGWAGVHATHSGRYLDCTATGRLVVFNGLDFWRRRGNRFIENWVFVDMVHLFRQFGVDLLSRVK